MIYILQSYRSKFAIVNLSNTVYISHHDYGFLRIEYREHVITLQNPYTKNWFYIYMMHNLRTYTSLLLQNHHKFSPLWLCNLYAHAVAYFYALALME